MRAEALDPIHGRCPTCGQVVLLSLEARARLVECPRCAHRGSGVAFVDIEAPLPVLVVSPSSPPGQALRADDLSLDDLSSGDPSSDDVSFEDPSSDELASDRGQPDEAPSDEAPSDEAPSEDEAAEAALSEAYDAALSSVRSAQSAPGDESARDERTLLLGEDRTMLLGDDRTLLMGDAPTRVALDSPFLKREPRAEAAPGSRSAAGGTFASSKPAAVGPFVKARGGEEERTHLLLDPLDLKDERETPLSRLKARLQPLGERSLALGEALDDGVRGRWPVIFALFGVACGILPPLFDYLTEDPGGAAARVATLATLVAFTAVALAWLARSRQDDGGWNWNVASVRLQTLARRTVDDVREFGRSPRHLKLWLCGALLASLGLVGIGLAAARSVVRLLIGAGEPPSLLRVLAGLVLVGAALLLRAARAAAPRAVLGPDELAESLAAVRQLPPIVDLSDPLPASFVGADSPLHRLVFALSEWRDRPWLDEAGYRMALERHLQRHLPNSPVERERRFGRSRRDGVADLTAHHLVLIEIKHGFRQRSAERALARLREHAERWPGKPMMLAIFDASREVVFEGPATAALVHLHERVPLVTVRMPTRPRELG